MIAWLWYSCVKGVVESCLLPRTCITGVTYSEWEGAASRANGKASVLPVPIQRNVIVSEIAK